MLISCSLKTLINSVMLSLSCTQMSPRFVIIEYANYNFQLRSQPLVDLALYIWRLGSALGFKSPSGLVGYLIISGLALTYLRAPVSFLVPSNEK